MSGPAQTAPSRELLLANHSFPGTYMIKAFGSNTPEFKAGVIATATQVLPVSHVESRERTTANGRQVCVTLVLTARTVEDVEGVYAGIFTVAGLKLIL